MIRKMLNNASNNYPEWSGQLTHIKMNERAFDCQSLLPLCTFTWTTVSAGYICRSKCMHAHQTHSLDFASKVTERVHFSQANVMKLSTNATLTVGDVWNTPSHWSSESSDPYHSTLILYTAIAPKEWLWGNIFQINNFYALKSMIQLLREPFTISNDTTKNNNTSFKLYRETQHKNAAL